MNRLRQLLVLLLLMVSGNMAAEYFACEYVEPFLIATDNGAGRTKLVGLRMDPSIKTLVIPNKINGNEVCDVINRHWWFYSKPRYESWGNQYQRKMEFSLFERNCNMQTYEDDWPRFDVNPFAVGIVRLV